MTNPTRPLDVIILAAGAGTRMKSELPKVLHPVAGQPMAGWAVKVARELGARQIVVVTGHGAERVEAALAADDLIFARQEEQLGTAHAFLCGAAELQGTDADILILYGDTPLLTADTLRGLIADHRAQGSALTVLTGELDDPTGYGRIIRDAVGDVQRIVEEKAASPEEKAVKEFNSGVYVMNSRAPELARQIGNENAAAEYYLTDILELYRKRGDPIRAFRLQDADEVMGANDRRQLADAEAVMRRRITQELMKEGVTIQAPDTVRIEDTVQIGRDTVLEPGVILTGQTVIEAGAVIGAYSVVAGSHIRAGATIKPHSVLEGAEVGAGADVGPFARLRSGTVLGEGVHIGNFVETKNAQLAAGVKARHLAYLGDATIGQETNVGAGTIIANFDGVNKHQTQVGAGVFIGSNSTLVAPRTVGDAAFIAAGSTVHQDVPEGALAVARGRQRTLEGWSRRYWGALRERVEVKLPWLAGWLQREE